MQYDPKEMAMHDPVFPISVLCLVILLLNFLLKRFHQPYLIGYILAGILLGRHALHILADGDDIATLGSLGVLFLMFFLGMEIDIPDRKSLLLKPIIAQSIKTIFSLLFSLVICHLFHLNPGTAIVLTILLAFNSTAVVSEVLSQNRDLHSDTGKTLLNILLSLAACVLLFLLLRSIRNRNLYQLPFLREMEQDHELQVFAGTCICLGFALLASLAGLGGPVGAFAAGLYIGKTHAFRWLETTLKPFKVFFTALFFVALGLLVDVPFVLTHTRGVLGITLLILVIGSLLSALVFRLLKFSWKASLCAGTLFSQTGEFSLIACTLAHNAGLIDAELFKGTIAVIVLTFLISTPWALSFRKFIHGSSDPVTPKKPYTWL